MRGFLRGFGAPEPRPRPRATTIHNPPPNPSPVIAEGRLPFAEVADELNLPWRQLHLLACEALVVRPLASSLAESGVFL